MAIRRLQLSSAIRKVAFVISEEEAKTVAKTVEVLEGTTALIGQNYYGCLFHELLISNVDYLFHLNMRLVLCCILEGGTIHYASQQAPMGSIYVSAAKFLKAIIVTIPGQSEVGFDTCDNTRSRL
ncbi:hypothetical protein WN943_005769 [Citrus x changshan-huyou]